MNDGIHQMQALNNQTLITIHVYGAPVLKTSSKAFYSLRTSR